MGEPCIDLLLQYDQERRQEPGRCCGGGEPYQRPREAAFIDLAETLAAHVHIVRQIPSLLADPALTAAHKQMVFYLLWLGEDAAQQQRAIGQLAALDTKAASEQLAVHFLANPGHEKYLPLFVDAQGRQRHEGGVFDRLAARCDLPPLRQGLLTRFRAAQGEEKQALATALLSAHSDEALEWFCSEEGMAQDRCRIFARLSAPLAHARLNRLGELPLPEAFLLEMADHLTWYGNPWSLPFLRRCMRHDSLEVQRAFHGLLMAYFDRDDPVMFQGWLLREAEMVSPENYPDQLEAFWNAKAEYLKQTLKKQRYLEADRFDMKALFDAYTGRRSTYELNTPFSEFITCLGWWTGQHFYYDAQALGSKQCRQIQTIRAWLEAHPFEPGRWYRFGKDISERD